MKLRFNNGLTDSRLPPWRGGACVQSGMAMIERAGFWRRAVAAMVDLVMVQILIQVVTAVLFATSAGHVTSGVALYTSCRPAAAAPAGVEVPAGFGPATLQLCTSSLFGAPTRSLFVAYHAAGAGAVPDKVPFVAPVTPDGRAGIGAFSLDWLFYPVFILLRWACDRFWRGSPGRRMVGIAITAAVGTATAADLPNLLARRYARFAWIHLPGSALLLAVAAWQVTADAAPRAIGELAFFFGSAWIGVAHLAAVMAIVRHRDTFYDAPSGTAVATRLEISRAADMGFGTPVAPGPSPRQDLRLALGRVRSRIPRASCAIVALMVLVFLGESLWAAAPSGPGGLSPETLIAWGGMDRELAIMLVQPYRLVAAIVLHGNVAHLVVNAVALLAAGFLLEPWLGGPLFVIAFLVCGVAGSLSSVAFNPPQLVAVGASGAVLGLFAMAFPLAWRVPEGRPRYWLLAWPIVSCIPAVLPGVPLPGGWTIDRADHAGGEVAGLVLGLVIVVAWWNGVARRPSRRMALAGAAMACLVLGVSIAIGGLRSPVQAASLVPPGEAPATDDDWMGRATDLVARYPDDPRARLGLALNEGRSGEPAKAVADLDLAIALQRRLAPASADHFRLAAHQSLASRFFDDGDLDAAIVQYSAALAEQRLPALYAMRAISEFYRHRGADAVSDLRQAVTLDPKQGYAILWLSITATRTGSEDPIAATARAADLQTWPGQIVAFYAGAKRLDVVEATAGALDLASDQHRVCEVKFYEAEWQSMHHDPEAARPLLEATVSTCPKTFIEYRAASEELAGHAGPPPE